MPRMLELIRASALPSHQMMSASKGALRLPPKRCGILVCLTEHNKDFRRTGSLTLAGWMRPHRRRLQLIRTLPRKFSTLAIGQEPEASAVPLLA